MPAVSLQRRHVIRITTVLIALVVFWQRITVGLAVFGTFFVFPLLPPAVLGQGDGWDLENLVPPPNAPEIVPRIIHQVRLGDLQMRDSWREANESCAAFHASPEWRFEIWDTPRANAFVEEHYPELLDTYLGYEQEIQRSNVIRYLVLYKMGGMYLDLDMKCRASLDFFTTVDWISPPSNPTGINNAFMAAAPGHPFLKHVIDNLKRYDLYWISLYATDMFSTGCQFLSTMHLTYSGHRKLRVLPQEYKLSGYAITPLFVHLGASSWHRGDAVAIKLIGFAVQWFFDEPWRLFVFTFIGLSVCVGLCRWRARRARRAEKARAADVEMVGVEAVLLLQPERRPFQEQRRSFWRDSFSADEESASFRSVSPASRTSSSESTLHGGDEGKDEQEDRKD